MSTRSKKHSLFSRVKAIIRSLIIAFFYSAVIIFTLTFFFGTPIKKGLSILNTLSLNLEYGSNENVTYNKIEKKLSVIPSWGSEFGHLRIPSIMVDIPIYHGDDTPQLAKGAGHYAGSKFPGEGGSIILAAHNSHGLFYTLPQIKIGDIIDVETIYGKYQYQVFNTTVADYRDEDAFPIQNDEEMLILYTCYPVDNIWYVNDRFIAYAKLVGDNS